MKTVAINLIVLLLLPLSIFGQTLNIGIVNDASSAYQCELSNLIKEEITTLMQAKGGATFTELYSNWDSIRVKANLDSLHNNSNIDIIIPVGMISSSLASDSENWHKPTLATTQLLFNLKDDIKYFHKIFNFKRLGVIIPSEMKSASLWLKKQLAAHEHEYSIDIIEVDSTNFAVGDTIDAVAVFPLFNSPLSRAAHIMDTLSFMKIPVLAINGTQYLELGATVTFNTQEQLRQIARQTAVNVSKIAEGAYVNLAKRDLLNLEERAHVTLTERTHINLDSLVYLQKSQRVPYINMESLRKTEKYPNWFWLENSVMINVVNVSTDELSLKRAIAIALENNLSGKISAKDLLLANKEVRIAKAAIMPQLEVSGTAMQLSENLAKASMGQRGEFTFTGSLALKQVIYSEAAYANIAIKKLISQMEEHQNSKVSLDIILNVSSAYMALMFSANNLTVMNENVNATIKNLELAKFREKSGDINFSDVNRWESEFSMNKIAFNDAQAQYKSAMYKLNEVLGMPLNNQISTPSTFTISEIAMENQEVMELFMNTTGSTDKYAQLIIDQMYINSPELKTIQSAGYIADRKLTMLQAQQYIPEVALIAGAEQAFIRDGVYRNPQLPIPPPPDDITWNIGLRLTIPIFNGGRNREEVKKTRVEQDKLVLEERELANKLSTAVLSNVQFLSASYKEVKLAKRAFNAAQANYDMVQDAYLTGVANISQLIDAQTVMLKTKIMTLSAQYQYALDFIKTERLQGKYTFLDNESEKKSYRELMLTYLNK